MYNDVHSYVLPGLIPQHQQGMYAGSARVSLHQSAVAHGRPGPNGANRPGQQTVPSTAHRPDRWAFCQRPATRSKWHVRHHTHSSSTEPFDHLRSKANRPLSPFGLCCLATSDVKVPNKRECLRRALCGTHYNLSGRRYLMTWWWQAEMYLWLQMQLFTSGFA